MSNLGRRPAPDEHVDFYEGLVRKTASLIERDVEEEFEDICQVLRIKVFRALAAYDPKRSRMERKRFVFMALMNQKKDLLNKKKRNLAFIEDFSGEHFDREHLSVEEEATFAPVDEEPPTLPNTLTPIERQVVVRLYAGRTQVEARRELGLKRIQMERTVARIRDKLGDWRPDGEPLRLPVAV